MQHEMMNIQKLGKLNHKVEHDGYKWIVYLYDKNIEAAGDQLTKAISLALSLYAYS